MAGVFNGAVQVATRKHGMTKDNAPIDLKSLNPKAMIDATALAGTTGTDAKLIHGDRWQQIDGNETDFITKNLMRTIDQNETRMLLGNLETTVMGTTKDDRFDLYLNNFFEASTFNYFHHRIETHTAEEQENQPTSHREVINDEKKEKKESYEFSWHKEEVTIFYAGVTTTKIEALGTVAEGFGGKVGMGLIEATGIGWKNKAEALETRLNALAAKLTGAEIESGGPDTSIRPVFVGILVAVHIDSPFA